MPPYVEYELKVNTWKMKMVNNMGGVIYILKFNNEKNYCKMSIMWITIQNNLL